MGSRNSNRPRNLKHTSTEAAAEARAQAEAYESIFANTDLELDGGETISIPPHPDFGLLDDDRMEEYEELQFERDETYMRLPDVVVPEQRLRDPESGQETGVVLPGDTIRGALISPYRIMGEDGKPQLIKPPWRVKVVQAALGEAEFKKLKAGGRNAADVWRIWGRQGLTAQNRQVVDPKSDAGTVALEAVPETDSE